MTVQSTTSRADYTGNGTTTAFAVPFYFLDNTHVQVIRTIISTGVATTLSEGSDYTLTGAGVSSGGTVTTTTAPTSAQKLSVLRNVPLTQLTHYVENDPFPAASHEKALDQLTMENQQSRESIDRCIKLSATNTMTSTEFIVPAATRANKVLGFDATGELTVAQGIGDYRGNWASGVAYNARDMVKDSTNNNLYICNTAHTSTGALPISSNTDAAKWDILVDAAAAAASEAAAAASASAASSSASAASTSASSASTSASSASSSASSASTSATSAAASYTTFHNTYYGALSSDPSTRPDGSSRTTGDLYWNTTAGSMKTWSGSAWTVAYNTGGGTALLAANNLSDLVNAVAARTNLGLGTAAVLDVGTTANKVVQLTAAGKLPAVDGSLLTGIATGAAGSNTQIQYNSSGAFAGSANYTFDGTNVALAGTLAMGSSFLRNRLINGGFKIDQRNSGNSQTITAAAALAYTADRWYAYCTGANVTGQQVAGTAPSQYAYKFTGATSNTLVGFGQRIEQLNSYDLASGAVTISAFMTASTNTTITWYLYGPSSTADTFGTIASPTVTQIATGTFSVTSSRTQFSATIASATMPGFNKGLELRFVAASGLGNGVTWTVENCQLEAGSVATAFEQRQYGQELFLCQRYGFFLKVSSTGRAETATMPVCNFSLNPIMFATPTAALVGTIIVRDLTGGTARTATTPSINGFTASSSGGYVEITAASWSPANFTIGNLCFLNCTTAGSGVFLSAEIP